MLIVFIFAVSVSACVGDLTTAPPIRCGEMPIGIYTCLGYPRIINRFTSGCRNSVTECDLMTCIFQNAGWLKDGKVEKQKVIAHFDGIADRFPVWSPAVQHAKAACLAFDLPAQGARLNCPAFDVMLCTLRSFIKNAQPSHWSTEPYCEYPRQFATVCPLCPSDCFAPQVPYGSCNACLGLPQSP